MATGNRLGKSLTRRPEYTFQANLNNGRHGWLRLTPAYSASLVQERLNSYSPNLAVLDPFGGTGTTALIAGQLGFESTTTEINPFLVWLASVKTRVYTEAHISQAYHAAQQVLQLSKQIDLSAIQLPPIRDIQRWWSPEPLEWLTALHGALQQIPWEKYVVDLLQLAFARCLIDLSNASYHHPSISFREDQPRLELEDYDALFLRHLEHILQGARQNPQIQPRVIQEDARSLDSLPEKAYDLIITSPPYVNRISYIRELRPYMYWLGYLKDGREAGELDWQAIGGTWGAATSRLKLWQPRSEISTEAQAIAEQIEAAHSENGRLLANYVRKYFEDMSLHIQSLTRLLRSGARIHYIVGNSSFYGVLIPVEQILARYFRQQGFECIKVEVLRKRNCKRELYEYEITGIFGGA